MSGEHALKRTALYDLHVEADAKIVESGGWLMPALYTSILGEHRRVRESCGVFDISHMGRVHVRGQGSAQFLDLATTNRVLDLAPGQVRYSLVSNRGGGIKDDVLISRLGDEEFLLVLNAENRVKILRWFEEIQLDFPRWQGIVEIEDRTAETVMVAVQGPRASDVLQPFTDVELAAMKYYHVTRGSVVGMEALVSRTGYTGEDGFEVILPLVAGVSLWRQFLAETHGHDVALAGLGARDTLRLEAGLPLYGQELDETINPLEAGLDRFVKLDKLEFIGKDALSKVAGAGPEKVLVGLEVARGVIARHGVAVESEGRPVGYVTSGGYSPTQERSIAMALIAKETVQVRAPLSVIVRGNTHLSQVVDLPFFRRRKRK
jgi:aminomethyltransferase